MTVEAALVGLFSALLGVLLSNGLAALLDLRRRHQRSRDILCAIQAEILAGVGSSTTQLSAEEKSYALSNETPFATPDETDFVFESVKNALSLLPLEVIHSVVQYYRLATQSNLMTRDLRDRAFRSQTPPERRKFVLQLLELADRQGCAGTRALNDIERTGLSLNLDLDLQRQRAVETVAVAAYAGDKAFKSTDGSDRS